MEYNMRKYHQEILEVIEKQIKKGKKEIIIQMAAGTGKGIVIQKFLEQLESFEKVLIITSSKLLEQNWKERIKVTNNIKISTYNEEFVEDKEEKYLVLENAQCISNVKYNNLKKLFPNATFIIFGDVYQINIKNSWLKSENVVYSYTLEEALKDGYINPKIITQGSLRHLIFNLLIRSDYKIDLEPSIQHGRGMLRPDFVISKENEKKIIEVKEYRSEFVSNTILNGAVEQVKMYRKAWMDAYKENIQSILIVSCQVSDELKENYYRESNVIIIDISNLIYLLQDNDKMMMLLIESVQYNINMISPKKILDICSLKIDEKKNQEKIRPQSLEAIELIKRLEDMPYGKENNNDKKYEKLCTDIIKYLFKTDFTKMVEQHSTEDQMFKMDLICGLKGTTEFWNILKEHYNTRFVVFEFKNYEEEINQNLIYITEKYLYKATLRNVAIIISRKGFSNNAHKAANGILTENGKLIIDLCDIDLITMLRMKADKEDASDYILDKLEYWLMSISK